VSETALVRLRGAAFGYGGVPVIRDVDLEVEPGRLVGILGPNGSGKTTLFRGILGLVPPLAGSVHTADVPIGYVPQRESLDPVYPLSAEEVVHMGAYGRLAGARRLAPAERALALECLAEVGLADRRRARFASLSGGQRQRVLIARALMTRPRLCLLDEPTSGVDVDAQRAILALLERTSRAQGLAVLLVSHAVTLVREVADEVLWVAGGTVRHARPDEILVPELAEARGA